MHTQLCQVATFQFAYHGPTGSLSTGLSDIWLRKIRKTRLQAALPLQSMVTCSDLPSRKDPWSCWCSDADGIFWESSPLSWHKKATNTTVLPWASVKIASGPCQSIFSVLTLLEHVGSVSQDSRSAPPGHWESLQRHMLARQARPLCYHVSYSWTSWLSEALRCKLMSDVKHLQRSQNLRITWSVHQWAAIWESII